MIVETKTARASVNLADYALRYLRNQKSFPTQLLLFAQLAITQAHYTNIIFWWLYGFSL